MIWNTYTYYLGFTGFVILSGIIIFSFAYMKAQKNKREKAHSTQLEKQEYDTIHTSSKQISIFLHDQRNHFSVIRALAENGDTEKLLEYLDSYELDSCTNLVGFSTGISSLDLLLSIKKEKMDFLQIHFDHFLIIPVKLPISEYYLNALISNLVDNAIEACQRITCISEECERYISLTVKPSGKQLLIIGNNSSGSNYKYDYTGNLKSSKDEKRHGFGLKRIRQIVEEAGGIIEILPEERQFTVQIILPLYDDVGVKRI